ncbi:MAG: response regulator transcription factor [Desulfuromonadales bacterium]|nr:response regulator transcription factor [Desulfuromonadales bacterium]
MKHILVIDDDPVVLAMAQDWLENAGYRVSIAKDAIYSNDVIYGNDPPDLILMDVMMPLMSGDKKVRALKRRDRSSEIPVLLISGKEESELQRLAGEVGADGYLTKPFNAEKLVAKVLSHLPA